MGVGLYLQSPDTVPDKPTRDDLPLLDKTANVMVKKFQKDLHEPLIELFQSRPDTKPPLESLLTPKTLIRFTFRIIEDDAGMSKLIGSWTNVDRAYGIYRGCRIEFNPDSTYVLTLTDGNIAQLAAELADSPGFRGKSAVEIEQHLRNAIPSADSIPFCATTSICLPMRPLSTPGTNPALSKFRIIPSPSNSSTCRN
jgi:hypothetical protein